MSSTSYNNQSSLAPNKRSASAFNEQNTSNSQPTRKKRSLSERLRNIFRRDPSPKIRTSKKGQAKASSVQNPAVSESPPLRPPNLNWSIGKAKNTGSSSTSSKNKTKNDTRSSIEISNPINYQFTDRTGIYGETFVPRTPPITHDDSERMQTSSNRVARTTTTATNYHDRITNNDRTQQTYLNEDSTPRPTSYISNRSHSPAREADYYFYNEHPTATMTMPLTDIEVLSTPEQQHRMQNSTSQQKNLYLAEKPPMFPSSHSHSSITAQSPVMTSNGLHKRSVSSSTLNNPDSRSITSYTKDADIPKSTTPASPFGSTSSKKKDKTSKSKSRNTEMSTSFSTIANLVEQNPLAITRSQASVYGSLPDAEILYDGRANTSKPPKKSINKYPWLTAIVEQHMHPPSTRYPPPTTTTTTTTTTSTATATATNPVRPPRFDTSTATLSDKDQNTYWPTSMANSGTYSSTTNLNQDGFIRPMSPEKSSVSSDIGIIRIGVNISAGQAHENEFRTYQRSESPTTYRSSTTVYARDKTHFVDPGEVRTWSSPQPDLNNNHHATIVGPRINVEINQNYEDKRERYNEQTFPSKQTFTPQPNRYSPRVNEQRFHERTGTKFVDTDEEEIQEERYEVSYAYQGQNGTNLHETRKYLDDGRFDSCCYRIKETKLSKNQNEQDQVYYHSSCSSPDTHYVKGSYNRLNLDDSSNKITSHTFTLKRTDGYNGLGILIATDAETRSLHFIREVEVGSPSYRAGLRKNDRIISVNDISVENMDFSDVLVLIQQGLENDNLQMSIIREFDSI